MAIWTNGKFLYAMNRDANRIIGLAIDQVGRSSGDIAPVTVSDRDWIDIDGYVWFNTPSPG